MEYYTRRVLHRDGRTEEIKVPKKEVQAKIRDQLREDQEMLKLLEKL